MKKLAALVAGGLLLCGGVGVATADSRGSRCEEFGGTLKLTALKTCDEFKAVRKKERIFEDALFVYELPPQYQPQEAVCFSGEIKDASLGGRPVEASSLSAFTVNSFNTLLDLLPTDPLPAPVFTAATVVTVSADREPRKDKQLGQIFLRDTGVFLPAAADDPRGPVAIEQLIGVGGTKKFAKASVSIEIAGHEFAGAPLKGTICR
ncbi:MAG: hypothetical protein AW10_02401 [Candidatus Accumulibacter appositus]|uniref:Uncharacterized protein n=1 Tax=Candidatus Accumulibacter appositus TaxID=1454003 RepID=A0A011NVJ4_9PROT|nr:hypothetical protein [Accumulibacter sp.]EXI79371.1 MAG: hypothetical protein AW10_02401 [Candidatus Accumulibacter appositus]HRF03692.1 hypothetical protein [Accumulibacter sp.]